MRATVPPVLAALLGHALAQSPALGAEANRVVSGGDPGNPYDLNLTVGFRSDRRQAVLQREAVNSTGAVERERDLLYTQTRNLAHVRGDLGLLPDLGLFFNLPFVISDRRQLEFDQTSPDCPGGDCVNAGNSSLLRDGILPSNGNSYGYDVPHGEPFQDPSRRVFDGPARSGIEYLGVGVQWAMFNQSRLESEATWLVAFESRFSIGTDQKFDRSKPSANKGVGLGYHQLVFSTVGSRTFGALEPYLGGYYMIPIKTGGSPYNAPAIGANTFGNPQHRGGLEAGLEGLLWQDPHSRARITFELRGRLEVRFLGLAQSELWEPLTGNTNCRPSAAVCPELAPHSGITRSPSYGVFGADAGLSVRAGANVRFRGLFGLTAEQDRFLTDGRSGYTLIDVPGRRFRVERARSMHFFLEGALLF